MRTRELATFKEILLGQRADLINRLQTFRAESLAPVGERGDEGDRATAELDMNRGLRDQERAIQLLPKIDRALDRIASGTYGLCECCEEPIGLGRLKARPVATLCISCKEDQEIAERILA